MRVRSADGVIHEFPDGTDMAVVDRVMKEYATGQSAASSTAAPETASTGGQFSPPDSGFFAEATQPFKGFNEEIASTAGRALDVVPFFANRAVQGTLGAGNKDLPSDIHPVENLIRRHTVDVVPPAQTEVGRGINEGGKFVAQSLPFLAGGGLAAGGARLAETEGPALVQALKRTYNAIIEQFTQHPVGAVTSDIVSNVGAGTGSQIAKDSGRGPGDQAVAGVLGGLLPLVSPSRIAAGVASKVVPGVVSRFGHNIVPPEASFIPKNIRAGAAERRAQDAATTVSNEVAPVLKSPATQQEMARVDTLQEKIPGFEPSLAQRTNDPALLNKQAEIEAKATGDELRQLQSNRDQSAQAIRDFADQTVPPVQSAHPEDVVRKATGARVTAANANVENQIATTNAELQRLSDSVPTIDRAAAGETLRTARADAQQAANEEVKRLRNAVDPEGKTTVQVGTGDTAESMTVGEALDQRTAVGQELRQYRQASSRSIADVKNMDALRTRYAELSAAVENVNAPGLKEYNDYYKNEYLPRFSQGASRDVGRFDQFGYGNNKVAGEDVPGKFFGPNNISEARQFNKLYGQDANARQTMTDYALDSLRTDPAVFDQHTGMLKNGGIDRWLSKNSRVLDEMPWIREAVQTKDSSALYRRLADLNARKAAIADSAVAKMLGNEPGATIDKAMSDWRIARTLKRSVAGDPEAEKALTRAVWQRVIGAGETGDVLYAPEKIAQALKDNGRALGEILSPQHIKSLNTIIGAAQVQGRVPRPMGAVPPPASVSQKFADVAGMRPETIATTVTTLSRGRSNPVYEIPRILLNWYSKLSEREANQAWRQALYDPKVAENLASVAKTGRATQTQQQALHSFLVLSPLNVEERQRQRENHTPQEGYRPGGNQ